MFEITPDDIALLNDVDLRSLVALLSEAEMRRRGYSTAAVTWGGHQDASDGGIDVRVALPAEARIDGFVPRPSTGFQVKAEDMPPAEILSEMCPSGVIRPAIQKLVNQSGAYVIASSKGSVSDTALGNRRNAMIEAIGKSNSLSLFVDFYDRTRLATWVRDHKALIPWVREKIGKAIPGWHSYGSWAFDPEGINGQYLLDERLRIHTRTQQVKEGLSPLEGIKAVRDLLRQPGHVVRLVGLSGVGKTRLVQALFDDRIGEQSLDPSRVLYSNIADSPVPQPASMVSDLIASGDQAILVIDNCGPDLHRRVSELCRIDGSTVSVITVEYDIQDDEPEGTDVFKLEPSSSELIEKLVFRRFPHISAVNARTIANFSDGNARVAIALAETVDKRETLGSLSNAELFHRLFRQRQEYDQSLLQVGQVCSLVYSFQGDLSSEQHELANLGAIVNKSPQEIHSGVAELMRRGLVQKRSVWRALLPHAIANRLASMALQDFPANLIEAQFLSSERLAKSFSRRLGYLHDSNEARKIVRKWLAPKGLLAELTKLNNFGQIMLHNIAPADPEAVLSAIERESQNLRDGSLQDELRHHIRLLRSLSYDASLFERCITLIINVAQGVNTSNKKDEALEVFRSLFYVRYSGTHATIEQRLRVIERLLLSSRDELRKLGLIALKSALTTSHFDIVHNFDFGARSRDFGYRPKSRSEAEHWFASALDLVGKILCSNETASSEVRAVLASEFRGLWNEAAMYDRLEGLCRSIAAKYFWPEGWIAVRRILQNEFEPAKTSARLSALENLLCPTDLMGRVRSIALSTDIGDFHFDYFDNDNSNDLATRIARTEELAQNLGITVAKDEVAFDKLLPELVSRDGRLWSFGRGLAKGTETPKSIWRQMAAQLTRTPKDNRRIEIFCGFVSELHILNHALLNDILDNVLQDEALIPWYPRLQASASIDKKGIDRLVYSLKLGIVPILSYRQLAYGLTIDSIPPGDFRSLLSDIALKPEGLDVAIDLLSSRLHLPHRGQHSIDPEIIELGRELCREFEFGKKGSHEDYSLGQIVRTCLVGDKGAEVVMEICHKLKRSRANYETFSFNHFYLLEGLFTVQPVAALDGFLFGPPSEQEWGVEIVDDDRDLKQNPLDHVADNVLLKWCDQDPETRYPLIASLVTLSKNMNKPGPRALTEIAMRLLENAPNRIAVIKAYIDQLIDITSWSGSRAAVIELNVKLLDDLTNYPEQSVVDFVASEKERIQKIIEAERRNDDFLNRHRDERFE
jgi:hypothetical protein